MPRHQHTGERPTWEEAHAGEDRVWSGNPNGALVSVATGLTPGTALDVGCGEGADAVWLAQQGWQVTALDPSGNALRRARAAAAGSGVEVEFVQGVLTDARPDEFDLVSVAYPALDLDEAPMDRLGDLVTPGGRLLVVHHAEVDRERALAHGFDPDTLLQSHDVVTWLREHGWEIELDEQRERHVTHGAGAHHHDDLIVVGRRPTA